MPFSISTNWRSPGRMVALLGLLFAISSASITNAQQTEPVLAVEEDWQLVVGAPDWTTQSPQLTCVISPIGSIHTVHCAFDLNHHSQPEYSIGGMQLQIWNGEQPVSRKEFSERGLLRYANEVVTWTARMELEMGVNGGSNQLAYEINDGQSNTWNQFGGNGALRTVVNSVLTDLNLYDPAISTNNSGVNYACDQVESLKLQRVRKFNALGQLIEEDSTERVVHPKAD